jgi:hypothetical protein
MLQSRGTNNHGKTLVQKLPRHAEGNVFSRHAFKDLPGRGTKTFFDTCPCFGPSDSKCDKSEYPTAEELAAEEAAMKVRWENMGKARQAIVAHLGGPWKKGTPGAQGSIDCPVCAAEKSLQFSRAGYNGHIHARCKTEDCVSWME